MAIERSFGLLKGRFHRLKFVDVRNPTRRVMTVVAACVLHNICMSVKQNQQDIVTLIAEGQELPVQQLEAVESGQLMERRNAKLLCTIGPLCHECSTASRTVSVIMTCKPCRRVRPCKNVYVALNDDLPLYVISHLML